MCATLVVALPALGQPQRAAAAPADAVPVEVALAQFKVARDADGNETLLAASQVKPGDVLEYRATYTNRSGQPIQGLMADLPIPKGLAYLPRSATPKGIAVHAATGDGVLAPEPILRTVDGRPEPVPYSAYRRLRWPLGLLPAHGVAVVSARTRVEAVPPPSATPATPVPPPHKPLP